MSFEHRMECLRTLKDIGYQVGCGFMVGSPYQTTQTLAEDLFFYTGITAAYGGDRTVCAASRDPIWKRSGRNRGTDPISAQPDPDVKTGCSASGNHSVRGTIDPLGREKGVQAGANVVMPNLSPTNVRKKYELYDNKICTGDEAAECRYCLNRRMETIGCELATDRGDAPGWEHR